jgi:hypothetical protein
VGQAPKTDLAPTVRQAPTGQHARLRSENNTASTLFIAGPHASTAAAAATPHRKLHQMFSENLGTTFSDLGVGGPLGDLTGGNILPSLFTLLGINENVGLLGTLGNLLGTFEPLLAGIAGLAGIGDRRRKFTAAMCLLRPCLRLRA